MQDAVRHILVGIFAGKEVPTVFPGNVNRRLVVVLMSLLLASCARGEQQGPGSNPSQRQTTQFKESGSETLELFAVSPALFVENWGQWSEASVRYVHDGASVDVAVTDSGVQFRATKRDLEIGM